MLVPSIMRTIVDSKDKDLIPSNIKHLEFLKAYFESYNNRS